MRVLTSTPVAAVSILALALALFGAADRAAGEPTEEQVAAIKASCRSDYMSYCRSVPRGGAEAMQCLKKNIASLSAPCQQAVKAATATAAAPAPEAKSATEAKPATTPAEPASSSSPAATAKAVAPARASSSGSASPTQEGSAEAAASAASSTQTAPSSTPKAQLIPEPAPASSGTAAAGSTGTAAAGASVKQPSEAETAAPAEPATTAAAVPPASSPHGFIPPRKKLMVLRNCRQELNTYCADVPYGDGRQLSCLESNLAKLTPDCQGALATLAR